MAMQKTWLDREPQAGWQAEKLKASFRKAAFLLSILEQLG